MGKLGRLGRGSRSGASDDRRFRLYGVGTAKSGTHSIAAVFGGFRTAHEPEPNLLIPLICDAWDRGRTSSRQLRRYLRDKDRRLGLEADVSQLNGVVVHELADLYPEARFLLTVRHPRPFLDSMCNHILNAKAPAYWERWRQLRFGGFEHPPEEMLLAERGLFTLRGYLGHWAWHHRHVLDSVPAEKLTVIPTVEIADHLPTLAGLAGVPEAELEAEGAHTFVGKRKHGVIDQLDQRYVDDLVEEVCGALLRRLPDLA